MKQTRGCRTTELFWEGQERLLGQEAPFPLCPGVCSHLLVLLPWTAGRGQSHGWNWLEPTHPTQLDLLLALCGLGDVQPLWAPFPP